MTRRNLVKIFCPIFILTMLVGGAFAAGIEVVASSGKCYETNANKLSEMVVTSHIPWAKPYVGGKIRVLVIGAKRETIELAQRTDLDYTVVITPKFKELGNDQSWFLGALMAHGFTRKEKEQELSRKLDDEYDVILLMNSWDSLSTELQLKLLWKIRKGTGLMGAAVGLEKYGYLGEAFKRHSVKFPDGLFVGIPLKALPPLLQNKKMGKEVVKTACLGKGRMLWLNYAVFKDNINGLIPLCPALESNLENEYFYSAIIKCLQWVAGKEPKVKIEQFTIKNDAQKVGEVKLSVTLKNNSDSSEETDVEIIDRMDFDIESNRVVSKNMDKLNINSGITQKQFVLSGLPSGRNFIDLMIRNKQGQIINWGTGCIDVPAICGMRISAPKSGKYGKPVCGKLQFSSHPGKDVTAELQLVDNYGREIQRVLMTDIAGKSSETFELKAKNPLTQILSLRAKLIKDGKLLEEKHQPYIVTEYKFFDNNDFHLMMFSGHFALFEYDRAFRQHCYES